MNRSGSSTATGLKNVPPFPPVAVKLLALLSDLSVEISEVARLIATDATFTARLLQRVNSIEFGLSYPVSNVRQAVALLGIDLTRQVTVTHATGLYAKEALKTEELRRCWQHMVATGVLAEVIADACGLFNNVAFTAGIMHDIGRLGLLMTYPKEYEQVLSHAAEHCLDVLDFEAEEFGVHHAEAGRILVERWGLPEEFAVIAGRHHDPSEGGEVDLLRIVHVACLLADALGYDFVRPLVQVDPATVLSKLPIRARQRFRMTASELRSSIESRILEFESSKADLSSEPPPPYAEEEEAEVVAETDVPDSGVEQPPVHGASHDQGRSRKKSLTLAVAASVLLVAGAAAVLIWRLM